MILSFQWRATTQKSPCRRAWGFGIWKPLSRWITKDGKYSNLITSEFHHISSRLYYMKKAANPCLLLHENDIDHNKRKVAGVVERAALEMR